MKYLKVVLAKILIYEFRIDNFAKKIIKFL